MDIQQMHEGFRLKYPEISRAADANHVAIWERSEAGASPLWFESLAAVLNSRMGIPEYHDEIAAIFHDMGIKFRNGGEDIKKCIDVCFVENLFWQVPAGRAAHAWARLPKNLQQRYIAFHGQPPSK